MIDETDDVQFDALTAKITRDTAFRCASYKDKCLRRRIAVRMRAHGLAQYHEYSGVLDSDLGEYPKLLDALTINVTKFFRNCSTFEAIASSIVPVLWSKPGPIRIWSAGCASGEEAYSLATLFYRHAVATNNMAELDRVEVIGSDIDRESHVAAERAVYAATAFSETPDELIDPYFPLAEAGRTVLPAIRAMVRFDRRDILQEPPPLPMFDLIVCRNVIIYFDRTAQDELFEQFYKSLSPTGFMVLGRVETLLGTPRTLFNAVDLRERIFQKRDQ